MGIGSMGPMEIVIILGVVVLLFGGKKIPELAKGVGKGIREFKKAQAGMDDKEITEKSSTSEEKSE
jgi:sec-independent protein translocase protein TatA